MIAYRFCPMCGTALETRRIPANDGPERRVCSVCGFIQWGNSKPTAAALVLNERGEVLLGRRNSAPFQGWWDIPGGFLEAGEHPDLGVRRELQEETGLEIDTLQFLGLFQDVYAEAGAEGEDLLGCYYIARLPEGASPIANDDIESLRWFAPQEVPIEDVAFDGNRAALRAWLQRRES
jgi:ADP-ribose pyrophosphatase YjhB (NUDIX family)